jgi:hypothetical protein
MHISPGCVTAIAAQTHTTYNDKQFHSHTRATHWQPNNVDIISLLVEYLPIVSGLMRSTIRLTGPVLSDDTFKPFHQLHCLSPTHQTAPWLATSPHPRLRDAQVKDPILALCPTCWMEEEAPDHLSLWDQCQGVWHRPFNLYSKRHTVNPTIQLAAVIFKIYCILWTQRQLRNPTCWSS